MKDHDSHGIVVTEAERLDNSVIITYNTGEGAIYSADLLYSILPQAEKLDRAAEQATTDEDDAATPGS